MSQTQEDRIKELLAKYASFVHQTPDEKVRAVRLCGILAYLISMQEQEITVDAGIKQLEKFLDKLVLPYTGDNENKKAEEDEKGEVIS